MSEEIFNDTNSEVKNVFSIIQGDRPEDVTPVADTIPQNEYRITDINGSEFYAEGFLLFTSHHIAVMRDTGSGAIPVFVMPLNMVVVAEIVEDDEIFDEIEEVL